ncbi:DUF3379 domain-containing protein [Maribacter algarum]|uniref:DUF3379 domain-containing protein n=1 Tax=Maribacter algarum (ex Zhang et al. 2020) TaxID=2578118 RepID=A0A5S3PQF6_9FLAO|nr:DUF3379 domain-containing protein [Maribacter algarum]TMM55895.1 DUF3379 domain-containing protein [Maribacter algarum]
MDKNNINRLFDKLQGTFDTEEPKGGHQQRFLEKLQASQGVASIQKKSNAWWKPLSIAASVVILLGIGFSMYNTSPTVNQQVAEISPEVSQTQFYFASLIDEQVKLLESESTPETKKMIDDTMIQLNRLDANYKVLEQDLLNGGNSKLILSAMINNFQTRIDLLQDVLDQVSTIKNLKKYNDENYTI